MVNSEKLFEQVLEFPDPAAQTRLGALVGIDEIKLRVIAEASLLLDPEIVSRWSGKHHGKMIRAGEEVIRRTPLFVFAGDVGTGKTELAETRVLERRLRAHERMQRLPTCRLVQFLHRLGRP